MIGLRYSVMQW